MITYPPPSDEGGAERLSEAEGEIKQIYCYYRSWNQPLLRQGMH